MADNYSSGSASSFADLLSALNTFVGANGWTTSAANTGRFFSRGGCIAHVYANTDGLYITGATGTSSGDPTGAADHYARIGSVAPTTISFPVSYEFYINDTPDEVYVAVSYGGDKNQYLHFGKSDIPGIGGTGMWFSASMRDDSSSSTVYMNATETNCDTYITGNSLGYFMDQISGGPASYIHCALEGTGWKPMCAGFNTPGALIGSGDVMAGIIRALPSQYNESEVLLPIYATLIRTDGTCTIVATLRHARLMRIDNVSPGDVITYGADQWKCYPFYAKNSAQRDGVNWDIGAEHSGTFGIALRYYGV